MWIEAQDPAVCGAAVFLFIRAERVDAHCRVEGTVTNSGLTSPGERL